MKVRRAAGLLATLLWLFIGRAEAQPAPKLHRVVVTSEEGPALDEALLAALRELFTRVGLVLVETDEGKDEGLLARVRIQRDADAATVRVFSVTAKKLASTHRVPRAESDALFRETVAHVVLNAVEPLVLERVELEATMVATISESAREGDTPVSREQAAGDGPAAHYGVGVGAAALVVGELWGARLAGRADAYVATRLPSVFGITLGYVLPRTRERGGVHSRFDILFARVQAGIEPWRSRFARLGVVLNAGVDLLRAEVDPKRVPDEVLPRQRVVDFMLGALLQLRFPLWGGLELQALVGCDLDLNPHGFAVRNGTTQTKLFTPYRARPYAGLVVAWSSL
jgi:hypothetical protein